MLTIDLAPAPHVVVPIVLVVASQIRLGVGFEPVAGGVAVGVHRTTQVLSNTKKKKRKTMDGETVWTAKFQKCHCFTLQRTGTPLESES